MTFALYLIGFLLFIGGVAWAMISAGLPTTWVAIAALILLGIGVFTGATRTRTKDPSA
jgi:uncharacterized membrane protein